MGSSVVADRRCKSLPAAFSVLVEAQRSSSVLPATEASATAPAIARVLLAGVLGLRRTVGMSARPTAGLRALPDRSGIAIVNASRITVHFPIAPVVYSMQARRAA
jgi:hypothetical protein